MLYRMIRRKRSGVLIGDLLDVRLGVRHASTTAPRRWAPACEIRRVAV